MSYPVPAAERTVRLIELVLQHPEGITPSQALTKLDTSRSTLFAMLRTLKALGYIEQNRERGRYKAGPRLQMWRNAPITGSQDLLAAFYNQAGTSPLDETLVLVVPNRDQVLILAQVESSERVRSVFETGERYSLDECSAGSIFSVQPTKSIRSQGYHLQTMGDSLELSLPICSDGNHPDAALLISAPHHRHTSTSLLGHLPVLREMAARLSYRLGAPTYAPYQTEMQLNFGPAQPLTDKEVKAFLEGPWAARLACIRSDGGPHVVPVWYDWDGEAFYVVAWEGSRWADFVEENPQLSLTVDEPWPPLRRVSIRGNAHPLREGDLPGGISALLDRISRRYLRHPLQTDFLGFEQRAYRILPDHLRGWQGLQTA